MTSQNSIHNNSAKNSTIPHNWRCKTIVVTGSIGSGKSTATNILKQLCGLDNHRALVISADELSHLTTQIGEEGYNRIVEHFGAKFLNTNGSLNRSELANAVFKDTTMLKQLESILHPIIDDLVHQKASTAIKQNYNLIIYDCPLFFEIGLHKQHFMACLLIKADTEICIQRAMARTGLSRDKIHQRLAHQLSDQDKSELALEGNIANFFIIDNSQGLDELEKNLKLALLELKSAQLKPAQL